jgi:CheY-like chemotaxis protein
VTSSLRLIHWNPDEAKARVAKLRAAGYRAAYDPLTPAVLRRLRIEQPDVVVVDLSRVPSQGRDAAMWLRHQKSTRHIPLVFVEGEPAKVAKIKRQLPDAVYTSWRGIRGAVKRAVANPPVDPVAPPSAMAGYSGTPLPRKLGIKLGSTVALVRAPASFEEALGSLPPGVTLRHGARGRRDITIWFVKSVSELERRIESMAASLGGSKLWIAWPKKASSVTTDVSERDVRRAGLDSGLVDYKICAIDHTWSGLLFSTRKQK